MKGDDPHDDAKREILFEKLVYGDTPDNGLTGAETKRLNLRSKPYRHYDIAGVIINKAVSPATGLDEAFDFKGNLLRSTRQLVRNYKNTPDWSLNAIAPELETEIFVTSIRYDALNRVTSAITPDGSITRPFYNEANLLEKVHVDQAGLGTDFVTNIDYNEKGQRLVISYGNGVNTTYEYDRETFRLMHLQTRKAGGELLQDLYYTYDPVGNITQIEDRARPTIFFGNMETKPANQFTYDALYRLNEAEGREHIAQVDFGGEDNWSDLPFLKQYSINDPMAWRNYTQQYQYDAVGNIEQMKHIANGGSWTRDYDYETANNRLKTTTVGTATYSYPHHPQHGFIESMPHVQVMTWNFKDELRSVARQRRTDGGTPETTYYVYDAAGQRIRKVTENTSDAGVLPTKKSERIYVSGIEIYRESTGNHAGLERKTLHVMDDKSRIAMVETRNEVYDGTRVKMVRYQFNNHLGTACLEVDDTARFISYEEYHPYGTTSYQAIDKDIKAAAKRYRYTGKERDEESGLYYHGARYYAPWLGRWVSCDPIGTNDHLDLYCYVRCNPIGLRDSSGTALAGIENSLHLLNNELRFDPLDVFTTPPLPSVESAIHDALYNPIKIAPEGPSISAGHPRGPIENLPPLPPIPTDPFMDKFVQTGQANAVGWGMAATASLYAVAVATGLILAEAITGKTLTGESLNISKDERIVTVGTICLQLVAGFMLSRPQLLADSGNVGAVEVIRPSKETPLSPGWSQTIAEIFAGELNQKLVSMGQLEASPGGVAAQVDKTTGLIAKSVSGERIRGLRLSLDQDYGQILLDNPPSDKYPRAPGMTRPGNVCAEPKLDFFNRQTGANPTNIEMTPVHGKPRQLGVPMLRCDNCRVNIVGYQMIEH